MVDPREVLEQRMAFDVDRLPMFEQIDRALRGAGARLEYHYYPPSLSMWNGMDFYGVSIVPLEDHPPEVPSHNPVMIRWI